MTAAMRECSSHGTRFVTSVGDNIYNALHSVDDPAFDRHWRNVYNDSAFTDVPWSGLRRAHPPPRLPSPTSPNPHPTCIRASPTRYMALGNHDIDDESADPRGKMFVELDFAKHNPTWVQPRMYYDRTFSVADDLTVHLVVLDTNWLRFDSVQYNVSRVPDPNHARDVHPLHFHSPLPPPPLSQWLEQTLAASTADFLFVVGHHPVLSGAQKHVYYD